MTDRVCIDCEREGVLARRKVVTASHLPARCTTHRRAKRASRRETTWEAHLWRTYALTPAEYWRIYHIQGGVCYLCQRARGVARKLSVDHDHETGFIRGLLCSPCNKFLGHLRDSPHAFVRGAYYLLHPPAFEVVGQRVAPIEEIRRAKLQNDGRVLPGGPVSREPDGPGSQGAVDVDGCDEYPDDHTRG